jgi:hypothetical protein
MSSRKSKAKAVAPSLKSTPGGGVNTIVEIIPNKDPPKGFEKIGERAIRQEVHQTTMRCSFKFSLRDIFSDDHDRPGLKTFKVPLSAMQYSGEQLDKILGNTKGYLFGLNIDRTFTDGPFFLDMSSEVVSRSLQLLDAISEHNVVEHDVAKEAREQKFLATTLITPVFYDKLQTASNIIESAAGALVQEGDELPLINEVTAHFQADPASQVFISTYAGLQECHINNCAAGSKVKGESHILVPEASLVGFVIKQRPENVFKFDGENFQGKGDYLLQVRKPAFEKAKKQIEEKARLVNRFAHIVPRDLQFYFRLSEMHDNWKFDRDTREFVRMKDHLRVKNSDQFRVVFDMSIQMLHVQATDESTAVSLNSMGQWFKPIYPAKAVTPLGQVSAYVKPFNIELASSVDVEQVLSSMKRRNRDDESEDSMPDLAPASPLDYCASSSSSSLADD